ncbi:MAG: hypothetical protein KDD35_05870, partial [Bdellovibrionales bacterium]|nr:hypothetical protein [Bdellovibrionales bacterium]
MKELKIFSDLTEATMARDFLLSRGIQATIDGAKNYSSHVVGGTFGRYVLRVEIDQFNDAQELLPKDKTENNKNKLSSEFKRDQQSFNRDSESVTQVQNLLPDYFRRSLFFAFASMVVLPIVFNVA